MKRSILILAATTLIGGSAFTGCDTPKDKVEDARENVVDANNKLEEATDDYLADIEKFRKETYDKIDANDRKIAELKADVDGKDAATKSDYWDKIARLEKKNSELKTRMGNYKADGKDNWGTFKNEFNHDMDGLGDAFNDITVKNSK